MFFTTFGQAFNHISKELLSAPVVVLQKGSESVETKELQSYSFTVEKPTTLVLPFERKRYELAEMLWYAAGDYTLPWITNYSTFWNSIQDDNGQIRSNYGMRIFRDTKMFQYVLETLREDPTSRQAVCHINTPTDAFSKTKDFPCTMFLQFMIRNNKLDMHAVMRSNDIWKGLTFDAPNFMIFQQTLLHFLKQDPKFENVSLGTYTHTAISLHVYSNEYDKLKKACGNFSSVPLILKEPMISVDGTPTPKAKDLYDRCFVSPELIFELQHDFFVPSLVSPISKTL